jgi:hypothetical protein
MLREVSWEGSLLGGVVRRWVKYWETTSSTGSAR